ncbi:toll/interleukin-1 receptor domain-containing protein, partial [bacterium]|nr:toll/interleukin-1 receptor domain-containing protein [bacterium]
MSSPKIKIFLSYSHSDNAIAKNLSSSLDKAGAICFMAEKDISAGELWEERVRHELVIADWVLILIT